MPVPESQSTELIQPILGMDPYVLIECLPDPDSPTGFDMQVKAGGGIESHDELALLFLLLVESLTGVAPDLYVQQIDVTRRAAGLAPLTTGNTEPV